MKKRLIQILIALILFLIGLIIPFKNIWINNIIFIISYIIIGTKIVFKAIKNIFRGKIFDENFLMSLATIGAFIIGEIPEAVTVMLFYQIGELLQDYAVDKSRKSISDLMNIRSDFANIYKDKKITKVKPEDVKIGDIILVKVGEKIPLDGLVIDGVSTLDTSMLTGESMLVNVKKNDRVLSGCINKNGILKIKVTKKFSESTVNKILDLVENASSRKSKSENFISKFAKYYTPTVVILALILAIFPPIIFNENFSIWIYRSLTFLVVSCPCALVISIPLGFFGGIGGASRLGILIKGSNYLEAMSKASIVVFDKTGTLTEGKLNIQKLNPINIKKDEFIKLVAHAESYSTHPIAQTIKNLYNKRIDNDIITDIKELSGFGIKAKIDKKDILIGNDKLMDKHKIKYNKINDIGTILYVSIDGKYNGYITISDKIKSDSKTTILNLKKHNIKKIIMLTGDKTEVAKNVSKKLGINEFYSELLPDEKVKKVEEFMKEKQDNTNLVFVGDGINDAPVLAVSDIGIAMGGVGSDAAIEAADIVIMNDELSKIPKTIEISKKTLRIVKQNIYFAISVKICILILSAFGISTMWEAVFADVGVSFLAILNSLRALKIK